MTDNNPYLPTYHLLHDDSPIPPSLTISDDPSDQTPNYMHTYTYILLSLSFIVGYLHIQTYRHSDYRHEYRHLFFSLSTPVLCFSVLSHSGCPVKIFSFLFFSLLSRPNLHFLRPLFCLCFNFGRE